ncbi:K(+)/H(+) antiporter [Scheffersomyces spartinae]|uniref:K(+)/H(+) antiporter n=1 Tax=Scheffersomyces spartinae TaxID=45513 RepID=A0A9P8AG83_9ASCO|nr:K(+)/H(+) antiporter [Scheffersomyces spartinae]KAG7192024.1 K(+)/H(+) antiporter [Scheffersomyces spartinae]
MAVDTLSVAGIVSGRNPVEYSASSPYTLFLLQALIIYAFSMLFNYPLGLIKQPRVIGEVITGIVLGPTVMGRIPNFTSRIFPALSIPGLTLVANIGIILFMFVIGLEVDLLFMKKNMRVALSVGLANTLVPFGLGCAIAVGLFDHYRKNDPNLPEIKFTTYMVFCATAICVTALPVLARILREIGLSKDRCGVIVLSAGIFNDLVGWILLALSITLANADKAVNTVYIIMLTVGWFIVVLFPVKWILHLYLKRWTNEIEVGPSHVTTTLILSTVFTSAWFTDIIGVHAIFGAFMVGLIIPRELDFHHKFIEKIDLLVSAIFIPLYFVLAGRNVNLGTLDKGIDWAYIIGIIGLAMFGKIIGGLLAARINGIFWRESLAVGVLMSCKGIVEIVVLQVGLNAKILNQKTFSMFILMAIITTFLTTPLTKLVYTESYRQYVNQQLAAEKQKEQQSIDTSAISNTNNSGIATPPEDNDDHVVSVSHVLDDENTDRETNGKSG